jgi:hypothetical protein
MAEKIEVWVNKNQVRRGGDGYDGGQIITNVYEPTHEDGDEDWNTKSTLVISDERVFTESEVMAMFDELKDANRALSELQTIARRHGISLNPA